MDETGGESKMIATRIPKALRQALKLHCIETGRKMHFVITEALREKLDAAPTKRKFTR